MPKNHYLWEDGQELPEIDDHSVAKHKVLESYLVRYVEVLAANHRVETLRLNLVDGFSGGGIYRLPRGGGLHEGSPMVFLRSMQEAEARVNSFRTRQFKLDTKFYFVEKRRKSLDYLRNSIATKFPLETRGARIEFMCGEFGLFADNIIDSIKERGRAHRSIFLLDQYGYIDVPLPLLRKILSSLPKAEIILTFAVDSLIDYISDTAPFRTVIERLGIADDFDLRSIEALKRTTSDWRFLIQSQLYKLLVRGSGAKFFTPFFITSRQSGRSYWLVHLSNHVRARDEMAKLHWQNHTYFTHHGGAGLNMLGYDPDRDSILTGQGSLEFSFDGEAKRLTQDALLVDIPQLISESPEGMTFGELLAKTCNRTPATSDIYKNAIGALIYHKELEVEGKNGERRRKENQIADEDLIKIPRQFKIFTLGR